ncbi:fumarylacetoacetate hydrolase family protein [Pseudonocardia spinosispora]|uniref:fumarylacetoacetate hydrolase family protein n=1 Tax=Pseudonocardia spinosispora TaxID=103441 RepID=UPI0004031EE5|nr:fumarylacetoacetate hydrolase family protein [Pseudonocardia spinosispora]
MRLTTLRIASGTRAARVDSDTAVELDAPDLGALLASPDWRSIAAAGDGPAHRLADVELAPLVPRPGKIVCVGLNYRNHILEMGRELPRYPTLFAKYAEALIGPTDDIALDPASDAVDWEAELALVVGAPVRRASVDEAAEAIAGFSVLNDVTMRDWQYRGPQWLQGKTFEGSTPFGPVLVTPDELPGGVRPQLEIRCSVEDETVQSSHTGELVFDPVALVRYVSDIVTLQPGDVIATGTPGGVGHARTPPRYLRDGSRLVTEIEGIGQLSNIAGARGMISA